MKKFISCFLATFLVLASIPFTAFASAFSVSVSYNSGGYVGYNQTGSTNTFESIQSGLNVNVNAGDGISFGIKADDGYIVTDISKSVNNATSTTMESSSVIMAGHYYVIDSAGVQSNLLYTVTFAVDNGTNTAFIATGTGSQQGGETSPIVANSVYSLIPGGGDVTLQANSNTQQSVVSNEYIQYATSDSLLFTFTPSVQGEIYEVRLFDGASNNVYSKSDLVTNDNGVTYSLTISSASADGYILEVIWTKPIVSSFQYSTMENGSISYEVMLGSVGSPVVSNGTTTVSNANGADVKFVVTPKLGYLFESVSVNGTAVIESDLTSVDNTYSSKSFVIQNLQEEYVISATFVKCTAHTMATPVVKKATLSSNGTSTVKCSTCGETVSTSTIYYPKAFSLSTSTYTYNGKAKKPSVVVKDSKGKTISTSNYTVSYASGRIKVGKYAVKITFKGNYSGTKTLYFTIKPKATKISQITAGNNAFTVKWSKVSSQATGYQVQYSTNSSFKSATTKTVSSYKTTSLKKTKLKNKKKYYVRVRTYKTVSGTKYYSSWSSVKAIKTK